MWFSIARKDRNRPRPPSFRPRLEALEERWALSTLTVLNNLDSGAGSLRAEISKANNGTRIVFAPSLNGQTITLTSGELFITHSLTIQGPGAGQLTVSGGGQSRVFEAFARRGVTLSGLTIANGGASSGGGIYNDVGSTLTVSGCTLSGNSASVEGGAISNVSTGATLTVSGCTLSDNSASYGGGIFNEGALTVSGCTLSGNSASDSGGAIYNLGTAKVQESTLSGNTAGSAGGGIFNLFNFGTLTVSDSVFSGNLPDNIYGFYTDGGGNIFS